MLPMRPSCLQGLMEARSSWAVLQGLIGWLFEEPNPIGVNTALAMCGVVQPVFRLPYVPLSRQQRAAGQALLQPLLDDIPGEAPCRPLFLLPSIAARAVGAQGPLLRSEHTEATRHDGKQTR